MTGGPTKRRMIPSYLANLGSGIGTRHTLQSLTALSATGHPPAPHHTPGHQRVLKLLAGGSLTVIETAAYLRLPVGVCKFLAAQLVEDGYLRAQVPLPDDLAPDPYTARPPKSLLEEVLSGLRALKVQP